MPSTTPTTGRIRVQVIGAQTAEPESSKPYTVYRTVVAYDGDCFERLVRYREFAAFAKRLKLERTAKPMKAEFPGKTWTRKTLFDDDVIEARQVMLNEYMKEVSTKQLTPSSEVYLMKLLRIGQYEDGLGRVSEMSSYKPSYIKSDRGGSAMSVVHEADEATDKDAPKPALVGATATLTATACEFPAVTSNATTVLADDERSVIGSYPRFTNETEEQWMLEQQDALAAGARTTAALPPRPSTASSSAPPKKATSIPPSPYSTIVLQKPALKSSQSLPVRRSRHVGFPTEKNAPSSAPVVGQPEDESAILSPSELYHRQRISSQLSSINRLLSDSDTDTELSSARSAPLTA